MYYKNLLGIKRGDLVLEVGPGATPYWRSDVLVDKYDNTDTVPGGTFGGGRQQTFNRPFFKIEDNQLPFKDNSFDWVICSHVLEHVDPDAVDTFLGELFRVARRVYLEFPSPIYEFLRDIESHVNMLAIDGNEIVIIKKEIMAAYKGSFSSYMRKALHGKYPDNTLLFCARVFEREEITTSRYSDSMEFLDRICSIDYAPPKPSFICRLLNRVKDRVFYARCLCPEAKVRLENAIIS